MKSESKTELARSTMGESGHCSYAPSRTIQAPSSTYPREIKCGGDPEEAFHQGRPRREKNTENTVRRAENDPGNSKIPPVQTPRTGGEFRERRLMVDVTNICKRTFRSTPCGPMEDRKRRRPLSVYCSTPGQLSTTRKQGIDKS